MIWLSLSAGLQLLQILKEMLSFAMFHEYFIGSCQERTKVYMVLQNVVKMSAPRTSELMSS